MPVFVRTFVKIIKDLQISSTQFVLVSQKVGLELNK
jgi:hypothetical protein